MNSHDPASLGEGLVERIGEALVQRILTGEIKPGARLRQDGLALEFAVSQGTMREAFRKLEALKLAESLPRRGVRVTLVDAAAEREIAAMRSALEVLAVRSLRTPLGKAKLAALKTILETGDSAENLFDSEASNRAFHIALVQPCAMPRLIAVVAELNLAHSRHVFAAEAGKPWKPRYNFDHWRIFDAVAAADFEQAASILARHINAVDRAFGPTMA